MKKILLTTIVFSSVLILLTSINGVMAIYDPPEPHCFSTNCATTCQDPDGGNIWVKNKANCTNTICHQELYRWDSCNGDVVIEAGCLPANATLPSRNTTGGPWENFTFPPIPHPFAGAPYEIFRLNCSSYGARCIDGACHCAEDEIFDGARCSKEPPLVPEFNYLVGSLTLIGAVAIFFIIRKK